MSGKDTSATTATTTTAELVIQLLEPRLKEIQDQIRHSDNKLDAKLDALQVELTSLSVSIGKNNANIKSLKKEAADNVRAVEELEKRLGAMEAKLVDSEDRSAATYALWG